jgi:hypothetical protein
MRFRQLTFRCAECGGDAPIRIRRVGLTPHHELVVHIWCGGCKRDIYIVKALSDCWRDCPNSEDNLTVGGQSTDDMMRERDARFLHSLGVAIPEEEC